MAHGSVNVAGIVGGSNYGSVANSYNAAKITSKGTKCNNSVMVGGVAGKGNAIVNCYNIESVYNIVENAQSGSYTGPIYGSSNNSSNSYYLKGISVKGENNATGSGTNTSNDVELTEEYMKSEDFYQTLSSSVSAENNLWMHLEDQYPILDIAVLDNISKATELTVKNTPKKFYVITEIAKNSSGEKNGGTISGQNTVPYEIIDYNKDNTKEIEIVPQENYKIFKITINGEEILFEPNENGSYTIPSGYFKNMKENKNIVVSFEKFDQILKINKIDEQGNRLQGAKFKITKQEDEDEEFIIAETNTNGQIVQKILPGKYRIDEVEAPEGYIISNHPFECTVGSGSNGEITIVNTKQKEVTVHYYLKNTGEEYNTTPIKLEEETHLYGKTGEEYNTSDYIKFDLQGYGLETDENEDYIIPSNASGSFFDDVINVYYYYEKRENKTIDIQAKKQWKMTNEDANEYEVTLQLIKIVEGNELPAVDENGVEITEKIRGNNTAIFRGLKAYENDEKIKYKVKEIEVKKLVSINNETQEEIWEIVPLNQFKVTYTGE